MALRAYVRCLLQIPGNCKCRSLNHAASTTWTRSSITGLRYYVAKSSVPKFIDNFTPEESKNILQMINSLPANYPELKSTPRKSLPITIPMLTDTLRSQVKQCVSLHIGVNSISWTHLKLGSESVTDMLDWRHVGMLDGKLHLSDLITSVLQITEEIPHADCYVLESPLMAQAVQPGSPVQININVQKSQLIAMFATLLAHRKELNTNNLFFLKPLVASRLYRTLVGTERVSTESAVKEVLKNPSGL